MKIMRKLEGRKKNKSKDEGEEVERWKNGVAATVICGKQIIVRAANHSARWPTSVRRLALDENPPIYWPTFDLRLAFKRHRSPPFWNFSFCGFLTSLNLNWNVHSFK